MRLPVMILSLLLAFPAGPCSIAGSAEEAPELVVTRRSSWRRAPAIDEGFLAKWRPRPGGPPKACAWCGLLKALPHYRVHDSFIENPATAVGSLGKAGNRDLSARYRLPGRHRAHDRYFGTEELWTFSVTVQPGVLRHPVRPGVLHPQPHQPRQPVVTSTEIDAAYQLRTSSRHAPCETGWTELVGQHRQGLPALQRRRAM
jgi:hypothetical protein